MKVLEIKCPSCGRHLDKLSVEGSATTHRKCKSCKNNIKTTIVNDIVTLNAIDEKENARDLIMTNRYVAHKGKN